MENYARARDPKKLKDAMEKYSFGVNDYLADGTTLLHWASISGGSKKVVKFLLDSEANVDVKTKEGRYTPLHYAMGHGNLKVAHLLLDYRANPYCRSTNERTPLHNAIEAGYDRCFITTIHRIELIDTASLLDYAIKKERLLCVTYLVYLGAKKPQGNNLVWVESHFEKKEKRKKECIQVHIVLKSMGFTPDLRRLLVSTLWGTSIFY